MGYGNLYNLKNLYLRSLVEASADDDEAKRKEQEKQKEKEEKEKAKEQESQEKENANSENNEQEEPAEDPAADEAPAEEEPAGDEGAGDNPDDASGDEGGTEGDGDAEESMDAGVPNPFDDEGEEVTDVDGGAEGGDGDSFDMDGAGGGDNPDGLPSADDDGTSDSSDDDAETNVQVNIVKLSKLDRALAKRTCFQYFSSLRSTIDANLNMIDKNEAVIDADVRELSVSTLNRLAEQLKSYMKYKFPIVNYEDALLAYFEFVKEVNKVVEHIKADGITGNGRKPSEKGKQKNKGSR